MPKIAAHARTKRSKLPRYSKNVPVTQEMLYCVRDELSERIAAGDSKLDGRIASVEARMGSMEGRLTSAIHGVQAEVHRVALLVEEQNARNSIVLEGLTSLFHRQDRVEKDVADIKEVLLKAR